MKLWQLGTTACSYIFELEILRSLAIAVYKIIDYNMHIICFYYYKAFTQWRKKNKLDGELDFCAKKSLALAKADKLSQRIEEINKSGACKVSDDGFILKVIL